MYVIYHVWIHKLSASFKNIKIMITMLMIKLQIAVAFIIYAECFEDCKQFLRKSHANTAASCICWTCAPNAYHWPSALFK